MNALKVTSLDLSFNICEWNSSWTGAIVLRSAWPQVEVSTPSVTCAYRMFHLIILFPEGRLALGVMSADTKQNNHLLTRSLAHTLTHSLTLSLLTSGTTSDYLC